MPWATPALQCTTTGEVGRSAKWASVPSVGVPRNCGSIKGQQQIILISAVPHAIPHHNPFTPFAPDLTTQPSFCLSLRGRGVEPRSTHPPRSGEVEDTKKKPKIFYKNHYRNWRAGYGKTHQSPALPAKHATEIYDPPTPVWTSFRSSCLGPPANNHTWKSKNTCRWVEGGGRLRV